MIEVSYAWINDIRENRFAYLLDKLPGFMQTEILRYHQPADRYARLLARLMLKEVLDGEGKTSLLQHWQRDNRNKPFIPGWKKFSITHSGELVMLSWGTVVNGIDAEQTGPVNTDDMRFYFHPAEQAAVLNSSSPEKTFYDIWTKTEALLKACGIGIVEGLNQVNCLPEKLEWMGESWYFQYLHIHPAYRIALCSNGKVPRVQARRFELSNFPADPM